MRGSGVQVTLAAPFLFVPAFAMDAAQGCFCLSPLSRWTSLKAELLGPIRAKQSLIQTLKLTQIILERFTHLAHKGCESKYYPGAERNPVLKVATVLKGSKSDRISEDAISRALASSVRGAENPHRNKRDSERVTVYNQCQIVLPSGERRSARLVDVSETGARLRFMGPSRLPRRFHIHCPENGIDHEAEMIWQGGFEAGIAYIWAE